MVEKITASAETLLRQASMTAAEYLRGAVKAIDEQFGEGYAEGRPELVAAFMSVAAQDFHTAVSTAALQELADSADRLVEAVDGVADAIGGE